jgi:hypothetical protein
MIHGSVNLPEFKINSMVRILSPGITKYGLIKFSWLKNKKRWKHNKRLKKKFIKFYYRYIPLWVISEWNMIPLYEKAKNEIIEEEDRILVGIVKK